MLVLSRKLNESILIGDDIEITVSQIQGNRIRLAISAPREVIVMRGEVADRMGCLFNLAKPASSPAPGGSKHVAACPS
jgi:carbon storage regulator